MPVLFDTGALELLRRRDPRVENLALKHYPPVLCPQVAGEYLHGQLQAGVSSAAILKARTYVAAFESLALTTRTADHYAELRAMLSARGIVLPEPYCWIAAHALEHRIPLVTTDQLFRKTPGLKVHLVRLKRRAERPTPDAGHKVIEQLRLRAEMAGRKAGSRRSRESPGGPGNNSTSALVLFTLYLAQDYLAESSALLQGLGEAAGGFW